MNDRDASVVPARALAASAGLQFEGLLAEVYRLHDAFGPDQEKGYDEAIRRIARGGAVSEAEERALLVLGKRGFAVGTDAEFEKFIRYARDAYRRMSRDPGTSPVALAILGVVSNYTAHTSPKGSRRATVLAKSRHPVRDILLGVAGGALGGLYSSGWNPIGGVVGGVVGGIVAGVKALC
jgi:hypothetical protein